MARSGSDIDHLLKLELDESKVTGKLRVDEQASPGLISRDALIAYLTGREAHPSCILQAEVDELVKEVADDNSVPHERVVLRGSKPKTGENARIDLTPAIREQFKKIEKRKEAYMLAQKENNFEAGGDDDNAIDFYNESSFVTAHKDEHIADFIEHTLGEDGMTVFGHPIAAKQGKPILNPSDISCHVDRSGKIIALRDGLVSYQHDRIAVLDTLSVSGYVDFSTGHINFPGTVAIDKGVRDHFKVAADIDIEIHKLVEASHLWSGRDIKLHQGMAGREQGTIDTDRNLVSGYLDAVTAHIAGDCVIEKEVTNCKLFISGRIDAKHATIRGGELEIAHGGAIGTLGSVQGVRTDVILASHPVLQGKIDQIKKMIPKIEHEIEKIEREVKTLKASAGRSNPELDTEIWFLESNIDGYKDKRRQLDIAHNRLCKLLGQNTTCELNILGKLFAKTHIWVPGKHIEFDRDLKGEFTLRLDPSRRPIIDWGNRTEPLEDVAKVNSDERVPARKGSEFEDPDRDMMQAA